MAKLKLGYSPSQIFVINAMARGWFLFRGRIGYMTNGEKRRRDVNGLTINALLRNGLIEVVETSADFGISYGLTDAGKAAVGKGGESEN